VCLGTRQGAGAGMALADLYRFRWERRLNLNVLAMVTVVERDIGTAAERSV